MGKRRKEEKGQRLFLMRSQVLFFGSVNFVVQQAMSFFSQGPSRCCVRHDNMALPNNRYTRLFKDYCTFLAST